MDKQEYEKLITKLFKLCIADSENEDAYRSFKEAQHLIINAVKELETKDSNVKDSHETKDMILLLKDFANSLAWFIIGGDQVDLRALNGPGPDGGRLENRNLYSSLEVIDNYKYDDEVFVLLSDLTTNINVGDLLVVGRQLPPLAVEMKEGSVNKELLSILGDSKEAENYFSKLDDKEQKKRRQQFKRLDKQNKRHEKYNNYLADDSFRYDEIQNKRVSIIKKNLSESNYKQKIQNAYGKLDIGDIKTVKIQGGLYVLVSRNGLRNDDYAYLKHTVYHRSKEHTRKDCAVYNDKFSDEQNLKEISGMMAVDVRSGLQGIANYSFKPMTASLEGFSKQLSIELLTEKTTLHYSIDYGEFIKYLELSGFKITLTKPFSHRKESNHLVEYKGKNISLGNGAFLTKAAETRIFNNFITPRTEINKQKIILKEFLKNPDQYYNRNNESEK